MPSPAPQPMPEPSLMSFGYNFEAPGPMSINIPPCPGPPPSRPLPPTPAKLGHSTPKHHLQPSPDDNIAKHHRCKQHSSSEEDRYSDSPRLPAPLDTIPHRGAEVSHPRDVPALRTITATLTDSFDRAVPPLRFRRLSLLPALATMTGR
ncbi:hypothetical protein BJ508DRAFT_360488 [Ascobolus immersus RN42]|uniref:Uncharacterized protein n=1 Tax=Ascobolus immersus RN42 TaxID=1160509 RepID=A0A3N4IBQ6_ASCIM|nr:hypothetical protein BJ508DRAFT_360488 [Ascobolus immersus RN42]